MISKNYKKIAMAEVQFSLNTRYGSSSNFNLPNFNFKPSRILIIFLECNSDWYDVQVTKNYIGLLDSKNLAMELEEKNKTVIAEVTMNDGRMGYVKIDNAEINSKNITIKSSCDILNSGLLGTDWSVKCQVIAIE